jgi:hypothetical protein
MRATAAARKRKAVDEANSKKQVRRERGQSIFAVQPKAMGSSVGPHQMAQHSMGMGMGVAPTANMGMMPGTATSGSSMLQPPGGLSSEAVLLLHVGHLANIAFCLRLRCAEKYIICLLLHMILLCLCLSAALPCWLSHRLS